MRSFRPALLAFGLLPFLVSGCAKSPAGVVVRSVNRIQVQLQIQGTLNPQYNYAVAFDDQAGGQGPVAILGYTPIPNGVVGGSFRLLVLYSGNTFRVFYRSDPNDGLATSERDISNTPGLFVVTPTAGQISGSTTSFIDFTIDLDAKLPDGTYIFPRDAGGTNINATSLNTNAITTNPIIRDVKDETTKPVDALGAQQVATPVRVLIGGTRNTAITDATGALNDENFASSQYTTPSNTGVYVDFNQIDISQLGLNITRSDNSSN